NDRITSVTFENLQSKERETITAKYVIDATELGDLLPLAKVEYVSGAESQKETGEPHAVTGKAEPDNVQALTWCFALSYDPDGDHTIQKPKQYSRWVSYVPDLRPAWSGKLLSTTYCRPATLEPRGLAIFQDESTDGAKFCLWNYRRVLASENFSKELRVPDVTIVNWPQNDYFEGNIIDKPADQQKKYLEEARELSLSLLYWLQTEASRHNGVTGYKGFYLRPDVMGTVDGLAMYPYIRESRRIKSKFRITELHVGKDARKSDRAEKFEDSVGIGHYDIDLHPSTGKNNYIDISALPFQIPLGALLPVRMKNLLPGCKNIGMTHVTNGCYRVHPVEWNIGESAGLLSAFCLENKILPAEVYEKKDILAEFQNLLQREGVELTWPETL
ncbi:MAG: FAD-dependent oxidoreductase, partial [Elusimicrobia bacterium RIFOXYA2_FULL_40_6]